MSNQGALSLNQNGLLGRLMENKCRESDFNGAIDRNIGGGLKRFLSVTVKCLRDQCKVRLEINPYSNSEENRDIGNHGNCCSAHENFRYIISIESD